MGDIFSSYHRIESKDLSGKNKGMTIGLLTIPIFVILCIANLFGAKLPWIGLFVLLGFGIFSIFAGMIIRKDAQEHPATPRSRIAHEYTPAHHASARPAREKSIIRDVTPRHALAATSAPKKTTRQVTCQVCGEKVHTALWVKISTYPRSPKGWVCQQCFGGLYRQQIDDPTGEYFDKP